MGVSNKDLRNAKTAKKDEFYTQMDDIWTELKYYKQHFEGKTVLCNCDDPYESNFFKYFALNFKWLGLKKLMATSYAGSPIAYTELQPNLFNFSDPQPQTPPNSKPPYRVIITEIPDFNKDGALDLEDVEYLLKNEKNVLSILEGDGDFRSKECVELLKEADIVVTNPPFSLFREFLALMVEHNKQFLIIGNVNAVSYKESFKLIKENKMWLGATMNGGGRVFRVPEDYPLAPGQNYKDKYGNKLIRIRGVRWFTNMDHKKRHEELILYKTYTAEEFPSYDNYDAINVDKTTDIPIDYDGVMGVPITFLDKYNPDQFEILGDSRYHDGSDEPNDINYINGKGLYRRLLIRKKQ